MQLVIGNKNYSSWSLRPWLLLKHAEIPFEERKLSFNAPDFSQQVRGCSPAGRVPVLVDGDIIVWDSLAIAEYLTEKYPERHLWPEPRAARARARSICAEMHAGFSSLRSLMPMNCTARFSRPLLPIAAEDDVRRIVEMWSECRERFGQGGPFLFGHFTAADAYYAPVVSRFVTYETPLPEQLQAYLKTITSLPAFVEWCQGAAAERDFVAKDEPYRRAPR